MRTGAIMLSRSEGLFCPEAFDVIPGQTSMPIGGAMQTWKLVVHKDGGRSNGGRTYTYRAKAKDYADALDKASAKVKRACLDTESIKRYSVNAFPL